MQGLFFFAVQSAKQCHLVARVDLSLHSSAASALAGELQRHANMNWQDKGRKEVWSAEHHRNDSNNTQIWFHFIDIIHMSIKCEHLCINAPNQGNFYSSLNEFIRSEQQRIFLFSVSLGCNVLRTLAALNVQDETLRLQLQ